ncbi:MAG: DMT family transporter [Deltaproteobacteria bacterium]|nr:DMT family transporter [Deltaproteobacteria bacterium]
MVFIGEIAALGTAVTWSACSIIFTSASRRIGAFDMNHYRMVFGTAMIMLALFVIRGTVLPVTFSFNVWMMLGISGFFGYFLCDIFLFQCYLDAGPRVGITLFNFYPFASAVLAWFFLDERLSLTAWAGMFVTMTGTTLMLLEKRGQGADIRPPRFGRGVLMALGAAFFQGISFTIAKPFLTGPDSVDSLSATLIRALCGLAAYWITSAVSGRLRSVLRQLQNVRVMATIAVGSVVGPSVGVWLSMVALKHAPVGIASTLMATMPLAILPMTALVYKEKITLRTVLSAVLACLGIYILFCA